MLLISRLTELDLGWVYGGGPAGARFVVDGVELTPAEVADRHFEGGWEAALAARWPREPVAVSSGAPSDTGRSSS